MPEYFQQQAVKHRAAYDRKMQTKSQRGSESELSWVKKETSNIAPAKAYWSEADRITKASGIVEAKSAKETAFDALHDLVGRIILYQELTITGLIIKAQAMQAWSEVDDFRRTFNPHGPAWADAMTETILRQTTFS